MIVTLEPVEALFVQLFERRRDVHVALAQPAQNRHRVGERRVGELHHLSAFALFLGDGEE